MKLSERLKNYILENAEPVNEESKEFKVKVIPDFSDEILKIFRYRERDSDSGPMNWSVAKIDFDCLLGVKIYGLDYFNGEIVEALFIADSINLEIDSGFKHLDFVTKVFRFDEATFA